MKFIDLFAGLGGFHKALHELGHECVFASELNSVLRDVYKDNWSIEPHGNIREIVAKDITIIPPHDILCAGFPCQPFSKAGKQLGTEDKERGTLFDEIVTILEHHKPDYFILENVPFIAKHDNEETWKKMYAELTKPTLGYEVDKHVYSPHDFGIPQHRKRIFIVGSREGLKHFNFEEIDKLKTELVDIHQFIENNPPEAKKLPKANQVCLDLWQEFLDCIHTDKKIIGSPIWGMEFGATYPIDDDKFPYLIDSSELSKYKGSFGCSLEGLSKPEQLAKLPNYAQVKTKFPDWKKKYITDSRNFYNENETYLREVVKKIAKYESESWQKLEWNVGKNERNIRNYILQFRASGIRVKNADFFPSLVCTNTQIPIIGWQNRYITRNEGLKLQSLEGLALPSTDTAAFKALGNAVNAKIVKFIAEKLIIEEVSNQQVIESEETYVSNIQTSSKTALAFI